MIGLLKGTVELRNDPFLIIDVKGVGYKVVVSQTTLTKNGTVGSEIKLFIHTHIREDALDLFGFLEPQDLKLFEYLIGVSGVGPKTAMNIFSFGGRAEIIDAIIKGNVGFFTAVPRLGKKNAQKVIIELKSKFGSTTDLDLTEGDITENADVVAALESFGFSQAEVHNALRQITTEGLSTSQKIKEALKHLGK